MYSNRSHVRDHCVKVSLTQQQYEQVVEEAQRRRCQVATVVRDLCLTQLEQEKAHAAMVREAEASINAFYM